MDCVEADIIGLTAAALNAELSVLATKLMHI